ncbi:MAG: NADH-quinone oxidoreductase subunit NuoE [Rhodospirillaceae bacterium]|nr:NADH-quinone oxidoreductase subunit NuoE [Rhodospirillaceae bacterium]|tara:strand:+ start:1223 stop:1840 length:618 start_codon:yes stop_codon:yes gene_type:complete
MTVNRKPASSEHQPKEFSFTKDNYELAIKELSKYPENRKASAVIPLLDIAQRQNSNWLPIAAINYVADLLEMPRIRAYEVATFYTMYNLAPVGENLIQICTTTPCALRGSKDIVDVCKKRLNINFGETTSDNKFTLLEVECLGACVNAPVAWIGDEYYEDLSKESMDSIIDQLKKGDLKLSPGSQIGRNGSMPMGQRNSLLDEGK